MKFSIITAVFNNKDLIGSCIESVVSQSHSPVEYIVIDGGSTDGSREIIEKHKGQISYFVSEPDKGVYDALNKGIDAATGDVVGVLHSDDFFANSLVLKNIAEVFREYDPDVVYGDLLYVSQYDTSKIIRYWKSKPFEKHFLKKGWMPPHPTLFIKSSVVKSVGYFNLDYKISSDYDYVIRVFQTPGLKIRYLPLVISCMRLGGASNKNILNIYKKSMEDYKIIRKNRIGGLGTLIIKNFSKLNQFFSHKINRRLNGGNIYK
jgi:glycosyltransferase